MSRIQKLFCVVCAVAFAVSGDSEAAAQYASAVISHSLGSGGNPGYTNPSAALGSPERITGDGTLFEAAVTPMNSPWGTDELVSIGAGGHITLKLSNYVVPGPGPEIGVFENLFFIFNGDNGGTFPGPSTFGEASAVVEVSANGESWTSLGNIVFNIPSNGFADASDAFALSGDVPSDFRQPFTGSLSDFSDKSWPEVLDVFDGSGGGTWIDISATSLPYVGYIRFLVASGSLELDAVSIANGAMGGVVPEPAAAALAVTGLLLATFKRRRSHRS